MAARHSLIVVDGFYSRPDIVRERALDLPFEDGEKSGCYVPPRVRRRFERCIGKPITKWGDVDFGNVYSINGRFLFSHLQQRSKPYLPVHQDLGAYEYTALVYLTPQAPSDCGTSFWRHKKTGLAAFPTPHDARRLGTTVSDLVDLTDRNLDRSNWEEIDRVGNVYNRCVIFRAGRFHSATRYFGSNTVNGRLVHMFSFSTL